MDSISPIVITSKQASDHLNDIKFQHADILKGIQDQSIRVSQFNADKEAKKQLENQQKETNYKENEKIRMDSETKRLAEENKKRELDIKAAALAT